VTELAQQRLLDAEPTREVRPSGLGPWGWWGVDPSVERVSIAAIYPMEDGPVRREDGLPMVVKRSVAVRSFPRNREGRRLLDIFCETASFADDLRSAWGDPGFVWVEQPFAFKHPVPPVSYMAQGVIMAAIVSVTDAVVESVKPPATWKQRSVGNGNANKAAVMEWARLNGCPSDLQDDCDAWAIAEAARRTVRFV
jgi:Holliday junction resolvasome RuvABC endonuclease subunit